MKKQPKLLLRERAVFDMCRDWAPGRFVEMGAGTGMMTRLFLQMGFRGACHDLGDDSRALMRQRFSQDRESVEVVDDLAELPDQSFDYLLAFEVLEHIEQDLEVLRSWMRVLRPGGKILVSVPAHARKYGRSDELVGHVRRYERSELHKLLATAGVGEIRMINYGYPLTEITRRVSNYLVRSDRSYDGMTPVERSIRSAQVRPTLINRVLPLVGEGFIHPFITIQRWFYRFDLGDGLVASGVKVSG